MPRGGGGAAHGGGAGRTGRGDRAAWGEARDVRGSVSLFADEQPGGGSGERRDSAFLKRRHGNSGTFVAGSAGGAGGAAGYRGGGSAPAVSIGRAAARRSGGWGGTR